MKSSAFLVILATGFAAASALAGESPYNPNAKPAAPPDYYYVCVAQSRDFTTRYVSGVGETPKPWSAQEIRTISMAWDQYLKNTVGTNKVMNAHCSEGPEKPMQDYRASELASKPKVQAVDWKFNP
jgi:hypothetical protein